MYRRHLSLRHKPMIAMTTTTLDTSDRYEQQDSELVDEHLHLATDVDLTFFVLPECHNVACLGRFGKPIDQMWMIREFPNASFKRSKFPACTIRMRPPPGSTHQIFESGKMMIMGIHSPELACCSYQMQRREFIHHGRPDYPMYPLQLENRVYSFRVPYCIKIDELSYEDELGFTFVPEVFPGAIYRIIKPAVAMLIFESGSIMILGVREHSDLMKAIEIVRPLIEEHQYFPEKSTKAKKTRGGNGKQKKVKKAISRKEKAFARAALRHLKHKPFQNKAEFEILFKTEFMKQKEIAAEKERKKLAAEAAKLAAESDELERSSAKRRKIAFAPTAVHEDGHYEDMPDI